jgi:hypothetical protein
LPQIVKPFYTFGFPKDGMDKSVGGCITASSDRDISQGAVSTAAAAPALPAEIAKLYTT